jgi:Mg2+/Co2+ transporter CorC
MAKHLGKVPIRGSVVEVGGLRFEAEGPSGRRNRIGQVSVSRLTPSTHDESIGSDHGNPS